MLKRPVMKRPPSLVETSSPARPPRRRANAFWFAREGGSCRVHFGRTNPPTRMPTRSTGYVPTFMPRYFAAGGPEPRPISIGIAEDRATAVRSDAPAPDGILAEQSQPCGWPSIDPGRAAERRLAEQSHHERWPAGTLRLRRAGLRSGLAGRAEKRQCWAKSHRRSADCGHKAPHFDPARTDRSRGRTE
jgi:hypothetical protein